jgi:hypothetical protein
MARRSNPPGTYGVHNPDPSATRELERNSVAPGRAAIACRLKLYEQHLVRLIEAPHADQNQRVLAVLSISLELASHQLPRESVGFAAGTGGQFDWRAVGGGGRRMGPRDARLQGRWFGCRRPGQHEDDGKAADGRVNERFHAGITSGRV